MRTKVRVPLQLCPRGLRYRHYAPITPVLRGRRHRPVPLAREHPDPSVLDGYVCVRFVTAPTGTRVPFDGHAPPSSTRPGTGVRPGDTTSSDGQSASGVRVLDTTSGGSCGFRRDVRPCRSNPGVLSGLPDRGRLAVLTRHPNSRLSRESLFQRIPSFSRSIRISLPTGTGIR